MFRAYQSPYRGTDCGPQCDQIPNFASRNQSGHSKLRKDSKDGSKGPAVTMNSYLLGMLSYAASACQAVFRGGVPGFCGICLNVGFSDLSSATSPGPTVVQPLPSSPNWPLIWPGSVKM